ATLEVFTLDRVKQENISDSKINKIKMDIKELIKAVKELTSNNLSSKRSCPRSLSLIGPQRMNDNNQNEQRNAGNEDVEVIGANI
ncbi:4302_t:CDS:2, partial [Dentiscutata heterogama]